MSQTIRVTSYKEVKEILNTNIVCIGVFGGYLGYKNTKDPFSPLVLVVTSKPLNSRKKRQK